MKVVVKCEVYGQEISGEIFSFHEGSLTFLNTVNRPLTYWESESSIISSEIVALKFVLRKFRSYLQENSVEVILPRYLANTLVQGLVVCTTIDSAWTFFCQFHSFINSVVYS